MARKILQYDSRDYHKWKSEKKAYKGGFWSILVTLTPDKPGRVGIYLGLNREHDGNQIDQSYSLLVSYGFSFEPRTGQSYTGARDSFSDHLFHATQCDSDGYTDQGFGENFMLPEIQRRIRMDSPCYFRCKFEERHARLYSSKDCTGMVGLENLGATCYLNALLQMLFHINYFRRSVYQIPHDGEVLKNSTTLALQSVFYCLQTHSDPVTTKDLTRAFGWNSLDSFLQQDVQEMMRVLLDKLEEKMKDTVVSGVVKSLFSGSVKSYIKCIQVDYESSREEEFYDIQLDVKGCNTLEESFKKYIEKEMLEGDNKYDAEKHGKQDAEKGVIFTKFPPILTIHLKRFEFDLQRMGFAKIHDELQFPAELCLDAFLDPACVDASSESNVYLLHSVLVHSGDVNGGHYYAFIRPRESKFWESCLHDAQPSSGQWFKFDDDEVKKVHSTDAIEKCFGRARFASSGNKSTDLHNAML
jgi:ubiquitin C-terminal hydrolase